jgi:amidase
VEAYLTRIHEVNGILHAVTEVNTDALAIAAELDAARANGTSYGALHGIPILLKNNIATGDRMGNTAGSWSLAGARVPADSFVVKKLRRAGAIILGKTNLSQWADNRSSNSSNGWSAHGGQTLGAYYPRQDPGGSSSGSGVVSSLGLALAALGTEVRLGTWYINVYIFGSIAKRPRRLSAPSSHLPRATTWSASSPQ